MRKLGGLDLITRHAERFSPLKSAKKRGGHAQKLIGLVDNAEQISFSEPGPGLVNRLGSFLRSTTIIPQVLWEWVFSEQQNTVGVLVDFVSQLPTLPHKV